MNTKILKQSFLVVAGFLFQMPVQSQMYVSNGSYVYSSNVAVFIKQDLELNTATSNFYLRNDAQLLQGASGTSSNKGEGSLSVFQEGTTNNFQYNYWCSPVGGSLASAGNSPFGITQLKDIVDLTTSNAPTILATNNYNGTASPFAIAPYWIWKLPAVASSNWVYVGAASTINAAEGFTMKGSSGTNTTSLNGVQNNPGSKQRYDFRGKPNDGTISIPVLFEKLTLTGNPYPSAIDLSAFLTDATNSTGIAYFWEQDKTVNSHFIADYKGGYGTFSPGALNSVGIYVPATFYSYDGSGNQITQTGMGANYERRFSPVGQGFMIGGSANGTVNMKNSYRVFVKEGAVNNSQFEKNLNSSKTNKSSIYLSGIESVSGFDYTKIIVEATPQIRLNTLLNSQGVRQLALAFIPEATDGVDHAMDAISTSDGPADIYFVLDDNEYVINALNFDVDRKIAIGFKNTAEANYKITVNQILNFTDAENIYIHDKILDVYHDIKNSFYDVTLPEGVNNTQFEITFKKEVTLGIDSAESSNFIMYQNNATKNLTINNPKQKELVACNLYDIVGKLIFTKKDLGSNTDYSFSTAGLSDGIYIVILITTENPDIGKKIIIKN
ncbi:T9SS type A sorting domain-containing protein [Flavobacterium frigoris]|uniref:Por secretion system C-terminal sorting domain-containing protein n=1 Tax=Flavobacterium frigoris TaxID=229204 RepID=A0A1H9FCG5_FLAFI|nr:T9SS type A sorting domain-containing protein [Flavobacterium frigoris]SEQ35619.1 Por secretion system C-terminal sorting domain-containing protein [Flavobacterium frigoris]